MDRKAVLLRLSRETIEGFSLMKDVVMLHSVSLCPSLRPGDVPVGELVQPPTGSAEPPQQGHQERGQD